MPRTLVSVPNTVHVSAIALERAACEKKAAAEKAELLADIGTHAAHMSIYQFRVWFKRKFGTV